MSAAWGTTCSCLCPRCTRSVTGRPRGAAYPHPRSRDALQLFGFATAEQTLLQRMISVSGIGPKGRAACFRRADRTHARFDRRTWRASRASRRWQTAERIVPRAQGSSARNRQRGPSRRSPATCTRSPALTNLGYQRASIEKTVDKALLSEDQSFEPLLRATLKEVAR